MNVTLSWDLFIIVFFSVVIAYSMIVGRNQTLKIIIGAYIASLSADGLANLVQQYLGGEDAALQVLASSEADEILITMKIIVFIVAVVVIAVRGGFEVSILNEQKTSTRILMTFIFGFLCAGLLVSTLLIYVSGLSLIEGKVASEAAGGLASDSSLVQLMIQNYNLWFSLPAIALVVVSFAEGQSDI